MSRRRARLWLVSPAVAGLMLMPASARAQWETGGSVAASALPGCALSATCTAFLYTGCDPRFEANDGVEISLARLPDGSAGEAARFQWSASMTQPALSVWVEWVAYRPGACYVLDLVEVRTGSAELAVPPSVRWVAVSASGATGLRWSISGAAG